MPSATTSKSAELGFVGSAFRAEFVWTLNETGAQIRSRAGGFKVSSLCGHHHFSFVLKTE
jgi:hypothetical protein